VVVPFNRRTCRLPHLSSLLELLEDAAVSAVSTASRHTVCTGGLSVSTRPLSYRLQCTTARASAPHTSLPLSLRVFVNNTWWGGRTTGHWNMVLLPRQREALSRRGARRTTKQPPRVGMARPQVSSYPKKDGASNSCCFPRCHT
ncbi:unnamed protein product, partial [Ectocarpus sp. 4 AP-2014]